MRRLAAVMLFVAAAFSASAQDSNTIRLYLDCGHACDQDFIKTEIPVVDFVNDRTQSDIHLLITSESTGSGGSVMTLAFLGQRRFAGVSDTLSVALGATDSQDEKRRALTKVIQLGLGPFLVRADLTADVGIVFNRARAAEASSNESDPWNYWVFSFGANGMFNGQESSNARDLFSNVSANRTTEDLKVRLGFSGSTSVQNFEYSGTNYRNERTHAELSGLVVKSIGSNWAVGAQGEASTSTFSNTDASFEFGPAIEYNVFPYSESTRRELRLQYGVEVDALKYKEKTIFNLDRETILGQYLSVNLDLKQPWGSLSLSTRGTHHWTNFDRSLTDTYNLSVFAGADVRVVRGLSLNVMGSYSLIRDQFSLPLSGATDEEVLLQSRRLKTGYDYFFVVGFSYRFGSIFNNVVNPRFGGGGGGGMTIMMG